jgi:hypothetical protein
MTVISRRLPPEGRERDTETVARLTKNVWDIQFYRPPIKLSIQG